MKNPELEIKTKSGKELWKWANDNHGSFIWGPVLKGILDIEEELSNGSFD